MSNFRGVILDVDGTLVDSNNEHAQAWVEAMAKGGYTLSFEKTRRAVGMGGDNLLPSTIGVDKESEEGKQLSKWYAQIFQEKYMPQLVAFPQARKLLQRMKDKGLKLVVASSSEPQLLKELLTIAEVADLVEDTTSSGDAKKSKPDPDIIQAALKKIGYLPEQVVMLGDTPYDIEAAGKAGVPTIGVRCGGWGDAELKGALAIYDSPADLLARFDTSPLGDR